MSRHDAKFKLPLVAFLALSTTAGYASEKEMRTDELSEQSVADKARRFATPQTNTTPKKLQGADEHMTASPARINKISSILDGEAAARAADMLAKAQKEADQKIAQVQKDAEEKANAMILKAMAEAAEEVDKVKQENAKALDALRTSLVEEKERLQEEHAEMMAQQKKELEAIRQEIEKEKQTKGSLESANTHLIDQQKQLIEARDDLQRQVHAAQQDALITYSGAKKVLSYANPMNLFKKEAPTTPTDQETPQGEQTQTPVQNEQTPVTPVNGLKEPETQTGDAVETAAPTEVLVQTAESQAENVVQTEVSANTPVQQPAAQPKGFLSSWWGKKETPTAEKK